MLSVASSAGSPHTVSSAQFSELSGAPDRADLTLADLAGEDAVDLRSGTLWKIPWELLMVGPFANCMLTDGNEVRHITAAAMVRSAVRRSTSPVEPLHPEDYPLLPVLAPDTTLFAVAQLLVDVGWEFAVVGGTEHRLFTPQTVFRTILGTGTLGPSQKPKAAHRWAGTLPGDVK